MEKNNKKGEITTEQIVIIIVLVASFAIILFLLFRLNLGGTTNSEICHQSVVLKTTSKGIGDLNCKTDYVCISGGGKCSELEPTITVSVDANNKNEIYHAIAEQMAECWWMFGEGQSDYSQAGFTTVCAVCSVVKFDSKIQDAYKSGELNYTGLFDYMKSPMESSRGTMEQTYLDYIFKSNDAESLLEYLRKNNVPEEFALGEKFVVRTGQTNVFFAGPFVEFIFGDQKRYMLFPYFTDINHMIENPQCNYYVTKS